MVEDEYKNQAQEAFDTLFAETDVLELDVENELEVKQKPQQGGQQ